MEHCGTPTPIAPLEPVLIEIVIQRDKMNQPLVAGEGLQLANSMIKSGSDIEKKRKVILKITMPVYN